MPKYPNCMATRDTGLVTSLGMGATTANCTMTNPLAYTPATGIGSMVCTVLGGPADVAGKTITWSRDAAGAWTCASTVKQRFIGAAGICVGVP